MVALEDNKNPHGDSQQCRRPLEPLEVPATFSYAWRTIYIEEFLFKLRRCMVHAFCLGRRFQI